MEESMIYVGTMRDPFESPKSYLRCFRRGPHESHEWVFYYDVEPIPAFCKGLPDDGKE